MPSHLWGSTSTSIPASVVLEVNVPAWWVVAQPADPPLAALPVVEEVEGEKMAAAWVDLVDVVATQT